MGLTEATRQMMSHGNKQRFGGSSVAPKKMRICKNKLKGGGAGKRGGSSQGHAICHWATSLNSKGKKEKRKRMIQTSRPIP